MKSAPVTVAMSLLAVAARESVSPAPFVGPLYACRFVCFFTSSIWSVSTEVFRISYILGGLYSMFGGLVYFLGSSSLPRYHVHRFSYSYIYILFMRTRHMDLYILLFWRAAKMVFHASLRYDACEPQTRPMWLRRWKLLLRENKLGRGRLQPASSSSFNHVRPASHPGTLEGVRADMSCATRLRRDSVEPRSGPQGPTLERRKTWFTRLR
jgi:hypothetical protein